MGFLTQPSFFIIEITKPLLILWVCSFDHLWLRWVKPSQSSNSAQATPTLSKEWKKYKKISEELARNPSWIAQWVPESLHLCSYVMSSVCKASFITSDNFQSYLSMAFSHTFPPFNHSLETVGFLTLVDSSPFGLIKSDITALQSCASFLVLCYSE